MTYKETTQYLNGEIEDTTQILIARKKAVEGLKILMDYMDIGTLDECDEAVEKQKTMNVKYVMGLFGNQVSECGQCGNELKVESFSGRYCHWCGQKLDWSIRKHGTPN